MCRFASKQHPVQALDVSQTGEVINGSFTNLIAEVNKGASLTLVSDETVYRCSRFEYNATTLVADVWSIDSYLLNNTVEIQGYVNLYAYSSQGKYQQCSWVYGEYSLHQCLSGDRNVTFYAYA